MARAHDESDLLRLSSLEFQRALLKVPDALLVQALAAAPAALGRHLAANLSRQRSSEISFHAARLRVSGELGDRAARTALRNLVRRVFDVAGPEAEAAEESAKVGAPARKEESKEEPDLTPGAFARLREVRGVVLALEGISPGAGDLKRARSGMAGAVLLRRWLGKRPAVSREQIYAAICKGRPPPPASTPRRWRPPSC